MKKHKQILSIAIIVSVSISPSLFGQDAASSVSGKAKQPRYGDKLNRQQAEYIDLGGPSKNKETVWDISGIKIVNPNQKTTYQKPRSQKKGELYIMGMDTFRVKETREDELLVVREHGTSYYYSIKDNIRYLTGYENRTSRMHYTQPLPVMIYPVNPGWKAEQNYSAECLYSSTVTMSLHGTYRIEADAAGRMVLPSKDVLQNVVCVRSEQTILSDPVGSMDSIRVDTRIENCRWYTPDSPYPVFETIKTIHRKDKSEDCFTAAFYFSPEEQQRVEQKDVWNDLTYTVSPNPVQELLNLKLSLPVSVRNIRLEIYDTAGQPVMAEDRGSSPAGDCLLQLRVGSLSNRNYVLNIRLDDYRISEVIMKR
jgi:hypothetical protein